MINPLKPYYALLFICKHVDSIRSWVSGMPRKSVDLNDEEYRQVEELKHKLNLTDREIYLRGLGIEAIARKMGRPYKIDLTLFGDSVDEDKVGEGKNEL